MFSRNFNSGTDTGQASALQTQTPIDQPYATQYDAKFLKPQKLKLRANA